MRQHDAAAAQPAPAFGRAHHSKKDLVAASAAPVACNLIPHSDLYNLYGQKLDILEDWISPACSMCGHAWVQARLAEEAEHNDEEEADAEAAAEGLGIEICAYFEWCARPAALARRQLRFRS